MMVTSSGANIAFWEFNSIVLYPLSVELENISFQ